MARTFSQIQQEIERLQAEAERLRSQEVAAVIAQINGSIATYGLSPSDLSFPRGVAKKAGRARKSGGADEAKYTDGQGNVWGGRGPRPRWLRDAIAAGHELSEFLVGGTPAPAPAPVAAKKSRKKS